MPYIWAMPQPSPAFARFAGPRKPRSTQPVDHWHWAMNLAPCQPRIPPPPCQPCIVKCFPKAAALVPTSFPWKNARQPSPPKECPACLLTAASPFSGPLPEGVQGLRTQKPGAPACLPFPFPAPSLPGRPKGQGSGWRRLPRSLCMRPGRPGLPPLRLPLEALGWLASGPPGSFCDLSLRTGWPKKGNGWLCFPESHPGCGRLRPKTPVIPVVTANSLCTAACGGRVCFPWRSAPRMVVSWLGPKKRTFHLFVIPSPLQAFTQSGK